MKRTQLIVALAAILTLPAVMWAEREKSAAGIKSLDRRSISTDRENDDLHWYITGKRDKDGNEEPTIEASETYGTREVKVASFSSIHMKSVINVVYKQGAQGITLKAPENCLEHIACEVKGETLVIDFSKNLKCRKGMMFTAYVSSPELTEVKSTGTGDFTTQALTVRDFVVSLNGTGNFVATDIDGNDVRLNLRGTGDVELNSIMSPSLTVNLTGTGDVDIEKNINSSNIEMRLTGTGSVGVANKIDCDDMKIENRGTGKITVARVDAKDCSMYGSGTGSTVINSIKTSFLTVQETGTGLARIQDINAGTLTLKCSGAGRIRVNGKWNDISVSSSRAGRVTVNGRRSE